MLQQSYHCQHYFKIQVVEEQKLHHRHLLFFQNQMILLYFHEHHLHFFFLEFIKLSSKMSSASAPSTFAEPFLAQVLEDLAIHDFFYQFLLTLYLLSLLFPLFIFVFVNQINFLLV